MAAAVELSADAIGKWKFHYGDLWKESGSQNGTMQIKTDGTASARYGYRRFHDFSGGMMTRGWSADIEASGTWKAVSKDGAYIKAAGCKPEDLVGATVTLSFPETVDCVSEETIEYPGGGPKDETSTSTAPVKVGEVTFVVGLKDGKPVCKAPGAYSEGKLRWYDGVLQAE